MKFLEVIENNHKSETGAIIWNLSVLKMTTDFSYGISVLYAVIIAVNNLMSTCGHQTIPLDSLAHIYIPFKHSHSRTLEEFVSMTDEFTHLDYTNIMKYFKSILDDNDIDTAHLAEKAAQISNEELIKIKSALAEDITDLIKVVNDLTKDDVSLVGYPFGEIPDDKINDAMHYAKDAMINVIKDVAKDIWDIITGQNQIDLMPNFPNLEALSFQQLPQPLVAQQQVFNPTPNYTSNKEIMKHFVIGNNVVIYDPHVQQIFEKNLISLSKKLDKVDKELKLKEPSKFGFKEFISPLNFKAVRLDESGNYINSSDTNNYIAVWTDKATLHITKSRKTIA